MVTCKSERVNAMKHTYVLDQPSHQRLMIHSFISKIPFPFEEQVSTGLNPPQNEDRTELNHNFIKANINRDIKKLNGRYDMK